MIDIKIEKSKRLLQLSALGHADYAPYGSDIVCAGVSSVIHGLSASLGSLSSDVILSSGRAIIRAYKSRDTLCFFKVAEKALELIAHEYPENVRLSVISV